MRVKTAIGQGLRSSPQALQSWEYHRTALETELAFEFVDAQMVILPFPLQHTKRDQATGDMMQLCPLRTRLTACEPELILADPDHFFYLGAEPVQAAHLRGRSNGRSLG